jgi:hypothetical protein
MPVSMQRALPVALFTSESSAIPFPAAPNDDTLNVVLPADNAGAGAAKEEPAAAAAKESSKDNYGGASQ